MSLRASRSIRSNDQQLTWSRREDVGACIGHEHIILQPHTTEAGHVRPGFDGADHTSPEQFFRTSRTRDARRLVNFKAKPVAGPMNKGSTKSLRVKDLSCCRINRPGRYAG